MSAKDKENKTFQEKLKQFFKFNKSGSGNIRGRVDFALTADIEKELGPETPLNHRTKVIKELSEAVLKNRLEDNAIEKLWACLQDLLQREVSKDHRHLAFSFFRCLVQGQYDKLGLMRAHFFRVIKTHDIHEDVAPRFELLQSLTENGKDILYFEEEVGPFLLYWMPAVTGVDRTKEFLSMLVNVIKFNAAYVDEDVISGFVENTCFLCCWSNSVEVVLTCLQVLDTVVCYSNLPSDSLRTFISALCRTVNVEAYCQSSWKVMRNVLGTHMGHSALFTMCGILQDPGSAQDVFLLRGAVFHVNMGLWGTKKVPTLKCTPTSILPSFLRALESNHSVVTYEVMLSIQRLVNKYGLELQDPAWDLVLSIIEAIIRYIETNNHTNQMSLIESHLHDTMSTIEQLIELGQFNGSVHKIFELIERCSSVRPETSVLRLVSYLASSIIPTRSLWLSKLNSLLERYFKQETRTNIRVKVLDVVSNVINTNRAIYEDDLIERIVVPHLQHIDTDSDIIVRNAAAQLLVDLCIGCENKRCLELMDILEKLLNRPFEQHSIDASIITNEVEILDVKTVVMGLINIFSVKLYQLPSSHAIKAYRLLVTHLESHYQKPVVFENTSSIRYMIFDCLLKIRANSLYHLGFPEPGSSVLRFSPYLAVDHKEGERTGGSASPPPMSPAPSSYPSCVVTHLSLTHACKAVIVCLKQEKDWKVLHLILQEVPQVMQNKALIVSRHGNDIDYLAAALCSMVSDKSLGLPDSLRNTPPKLTRSDFHSCVFPVLASLASYHAYLEPSLQQRLIKCLEFGLVSRCARQCVMALTTCTLEMRDAMYKLLPEVLLNLSKISATVHIAIPILEFLSTLTRLPKVFASFVGDQYMSVFAISLPYTNPFKYNHYTVSLAHHVIAVWFLKCRLPFRRDFVKFITTGLKANVLVPFEEGQIMKPDLINEDSSNRKRSSSLTEQGSRRSVRTVGGGARLDGRGAVDLKPPIDEALMTFHVELTETCIDLMARYTFSTCSALPKRLPTADFLLSGGQSMTWLLGNKLITVTTSGCSMKALKNGLCDKCWLLCRPDKEPVTPEGNLDQEGHASRRRHKSAVQRSVSSDVTPLAVNTSKDDLNVPTTRIGRQLSSEPQPALARNPVQAISNLVAGATSFSTPATAATTAANSPIDDGKKTFGLQETHEPEPYKLDQLLFGTKEPEHQERQFCACWCQGWAEIYVRRPTGDMSWAMRIQNQSHYQTSPLDFPLTDITTLFMPSLTNRRDQQFEDFVSRHSRINSENLGESEYDLMLEHHFDDSADISGSVRTMISDTVPMMIPGSPVKRSPSRQSSRESVEGVDPCLDDDGLECEEKKEVKSERDGQIDSEGKSEGMVSCEAIPEEISGLGTTPPAGDSEDSVDAGATTHPALLSCHSYPGTSVSPSSSLSASLRTTPIQSPGGAPAPLTVQTVPQPVLIAARPPQSPSQQTRNTMVADTNKSQFSGTWIPREQKSTSGNEQPNKSSTRPQLTPLTTEKGNMEKEETQRPDPSALPPLAFKRDRGHTISVMSPVRKPRIDWNSVRKDNSPRNKDTPRSGINPSFVFLQLYHTAHFGSTSEKPLLVPQSQAIQRAVKNLDRIPPYETHKVGVLYVGPGQASNEAEILRNQFGSLRYAEFLQRLGTLIKLKDADPQNVFLGGLDSSGNDGKFAYIWQDDVMQVTFHVATLMPTKESDPSCTSKKSHIGNNYVTIVYNESGEEYNIQTVKCQFNYACVVIQPLDHSTNQVTVKTKEDLAEHIGHSEPKIVSDQNVAILARQLALHANLASMISCSLKAQGQDPYASNWLERLRQIKRLRTKVQQESAAAASTSDSSSNDCEPLTSPRSARRVHMDDFTEYT
ncbi:hypothetical protein C0J52_09893 [Blattella germanica]|nr:hypothetical protein C0J52_09893 [Blattella germanica]